MKSLKQFLKLDFNKINLAAIQKYHPLNWSDKSLKINSKIIRGKETEIEVRNSNPYIYSDNNSIGRH